MTSAYTLILATLFHISYGQEFSTSPKIITTAPIVVPCMNCLRSEGGGLSPALLKSVPAMLNQAFSAPTAPCSCGQQLPTATIESQPCGCGCYSGDEPLEGSRSSPSLDARMLAGPLASFLASIMGGLRNDAVTVEFDGLTDGSPSSVDSAFCPATPVDTSVPFCPSTSIPNSSIPCCPEEPLSGVCNASEDKLTFGASRPLIESPSTPALQEGSLYAMNQTVPETQCVPPPVDTPPVCPYSDFPKSPFPFLAPPPSSPDSQWSRPVPLLSGNPQFDFISKASSLHYPAVSNCDCNLMPCQCFC